MEGEAQVMNRCQPESAAPGKARLLTSQLVWMALIAGMIVSTTFTLKAQTAPPSPLTITVSSQGLTPGTATANAGIIRLTIENQRSAERVTLRLSNQAGELIREISLPDKATEWKTKVALVAGQYMISDVSNSSASCRITVQAPPPGGGS